ncbi:TPA: DUF3265 domain-containing protein [Vibrio vulnificus]|nr:DUF3265 domain-containing protein [Vibrio vulnificus]
MRNAWRFHYALILVIEVVCGNIVLRCSPLKRALCDKAKFLGFSKFNLFDNSFFGFGKSAFLAQILESFKP